MFMNLFRSRSSFPLRSPWSSPLFVRDTYKKCLKVIDSCENLLHIKSSERYIGNFLTMHSEYLGSGQYETDEFILKSYGRLKEILTEKRNNLDG